MQFIHSKCAIQCVFKYIYRVVQSSPQFHFKFFLFCLAGVWWIHHNLNLGPFCFLPPTKTLIHPQSLPISCLFQALLSPMQSKMYFLFVLICTFCRFHMNGIRQYVAFCVRLLALSIMFSGFLHVVACTNKLFCFMPE